MLELVFMICVVGQPVCQTMSYETEDCEALLQQAVEVLDENNEIRRAVCGRPMEIPTKGQKL
jgi:hypothetical protein